jgi:CheY-like chemotaxis protein
MVMAPEKYTSLHLLLVDDDPDEVGLFCAGLRQLNLSFQVVYAKNHDELFQALSNERRFDLIVMDISLPGIDGIECLRRLKKHPVHAELPVIVMTVAKDEQTIDSAYFSGAHYYVVKPYSQRNYMETLDRVFAVDWKAKPPVPTKDQFLINYAFV